MDNRLAALNYPDLRGETGGHETRERDYQNDDRVEGRTAEVLDSSMSMRQWVDRAAENGMTVETRSGRPQRIVGSSFDENAYWGQRLGFSRPGAEMRTLNEDTAGSGQAITPQSWTARYIDYAYQES